MQSQALKWCIDHEYPELPKAETDKPVQFWQLRKGVSGKVRRHTHPYEPPLTTSSPSRIISTVSAGSFLFMVLLTRSAVATKTPQEAPPALGRGALCADSMGLVSAKCRYIYVCHLTNTLLLGQNLDYDRSGACDEV